MKVLASLLGPHVNSAWKCTVEKQAEVIKAICKARLHGQKTRKMKKILCKMLKRQDLVAETATSSGNAVKGVSRPRSSCDGLFESHSISNPSLRAQSYMDSVERNACARSDRKVLIFLPGLKGGLQPPADGANTACAHAAATVMLILFGV